MAQIIGRLDEAQMNHVLEVKVHDIRKGFARRKRREQERAEQAAKQRKVEEKRILQPDARFGRIRGLDKLSQG